MGQYGFETPDQFAKRYNEGRCRAKCARAFGPVKKERAKPTLALLSANYQRPEGVTQVKVRPWRSKPYRDWIKAQPCCNCGQPADDPHHEQEEAQGGTGTRPGDERCVPMCRICHDERQHGRMGRAIWARWGKNPEQIIRALQRKWHAETGKVAGENEKPLTTAGRK